MRCNKPGCICALERRLNEHSAFKGLCVADRRYRDINAIPHTDKGWKLRCHKNRSDIF